MAFDHLLLRGFQETGCRPLIDGDSQTGRASPSAGKELLVQCKMLHKQLVIFISARS